MISTLLNSLYELLLPKFSEVSEKESKEAVVLTSCVAQFEKLIAE